MRKIIGFLNTGMVGCSVAQAYVFEDTDTDEYIDGIIHQESVQQAEAYLDVVQEDTVESEEYYEGSDFIYESEIDGYWEDYNGEDHDGHRVGGGSFADDFESLIR